MFVVAECDHRSVLDGSGWHEPGVLAHLTQVVEQLRVAGVKADPCPGEGVAVGQRVQRGGAGGAWKRGRASVKRGR